MKIQGFHYMDAGSRPRPSEAMFRENIFKNASIQNVLHPEFWVLDYTISGYSDFRVEGLDWQVRLPRTAHLYPPGMHYEERYPEGSFSTCHFLFKGETHTLRRLVNNSVHFAEISDPECKLLKAIRDGATAASCGSRGFWKFQEAFGKTMELLENLASPQSADWKYVLSNSTCPAPLADQIADYLEQHCRENITMDFLARKFKTSKSTLAHKFKKAFGENIFSMLMRTRIEQSLPLLLRGLTLKEIAEASGFANEFYYSRVFRKVNGISPGQYRKI